MKKPIVFFDLETTGINTSKDRIVEIACVKVMPDGSVITRPEKPGKEHRLIINPEMPIPAETSAVHGIFDEDVEGKPTFKQIAKSLYKFMHDCDLAGFNSNKFDIPLLAEEFMRVGVDFSMDGRNVIDVQVIFHMMEKRTLAAGYKFYCGKELPDAHEALPDTMATYEILKAQIEHYKDSEVENDKGEKIKPVQNDMEVLHNTSQRNKIADFSGRLVFDADGDVCLNFGKFKGQKLVNIFEKERGYYAWMMKGDFSLFTKKVLTQEHEKWKASK
ncbi:MAG: exonuclease domain-containing protein [Flavobacteriales bacterium]